MPERSLASYGVQQDGDPAFLYLLSTPQEAPGWSLMGAGEGGGMQPKMALSPVLCHRMQPSMLAEEGRGTRTVLSSVIGAVPCPAASQVHPSQSPSGGQCAGVGSGQGLAGHARSEEAATVFHLPSLAGPVLPVPSSMPQIALAVRCVAPRGPALGTPFLQHLPSSQQR